HNYIGDADKLTLIFNVLLKNAVQFTKQGNITLSIEEDLINAAAGMAHLTIRVQDTGIGIAPEKLTQIFELFQQSSNGYTRSHEGLGVGLNICKSLTDLLGGKIEVQSKLGEGTTFTLWFTFAVDDAVSLNPGVHTEHAPLALLVEDNEVNQRVLEKYLAKCGCETIIANTGLEALERVNERHPDIVFMDCQMPVMDGFEATRKLRAHYPHNSLPIIAVTANTMSNDRLRCIEAGMNDYLPKPIKLAQIQTALDQWLPQRAATKKAG
ncbi:MAG TPA: response regulator, partial [Pseudomonadales bacterium]|nr:response regulator [Pseudomonadales bacterium]